MRPTDARRLGTWPTLVLLALATVLLSAASVSAEPAHVERQAWARTGPLAPSGAEDERLYVASTAGQEQARAFVDLAPDLDLDQLRSGSLVVREAEGGVLVERATLLACALTSGIAADGELQGRLPETDCEESVQAERSADGAWQIPLRVFATSLTTGRVTGVAVLPVPADAASPAFTVALDPARTQVAVPVAVPVAAPAAAAAGASPGSATAGGDPGEPSGAGAAVQLAAAPDLPQAAPLSSSTDLPVLAPEPPSLAPDPATASGPAAAPLLPPEPLAAPVPAGAEVVSATSTPGGTSSRSLLLVGLVVLVGALCLLTRGQVLVPALALPGGRAVPAMRLSLPPSSPRRLAPWLAVPALVMLLPETAVYKIGIIAIVFVGAIGLHILVNVAGELSLAHAAFVGIPAFAVARVSAGADVSPVLAVPVGVLAGIGVGLVVAATALRARGLQVALVTLAVAIGTVQFLFYRTWVVGPADGLPVPVPSLFGVDLETNVSRVPVLAALVALAAVSGSAIIRSKLGRGLSLLRTDPDVAAAAGIPVSSYRAMAYAIAGAFAGLAGASYVVWVQLVSPQAFPLQLGFTYLLIAALAGRGGLGGVAVSALIVQGGALFTFLPRSFTLFVAPVLLLLQVTRFEGGINASLRALPVLLAHKKRTPRMSDLHDDRATRHEAVAIRLPVALGLLMVLAGFTAIGVAWYNTGRTDQLWIQNQEIVSGGFVGLALVVVGCTLLLRDALLHGPTAVRERVLVEPRVIVEPALLPQQHTGPDDLDAHEPSSTDSLPTPAVKSRVRRPPTASGRRRA